MKHPANPDLMERVLFFVERNPGVRWRDVCDPFSEVYEVHDIDDAWSMLVYSGRIYDDHSRETMSTYRAVSVAEAKPLPIWAYFAADACGPTAGIPAKRD